MKRGGKKQIRGFESFVERETFKKSPKAVGRGLAALSQIWRRGIKPKNLKQHYFLTWFAWKNGNVFQLARTIGMHRNSIIVIFKKERGTTRNLKLRMVWKKLCRSHPTRPFLARFCGFYQKIGAKPALTASQNSALASLWLMGMPRKAIRAHYLLWGFRRGMGRKDLARELGISYRTLNRIKQGANKKGSVPDVWLRVMSPKKKDWYPGR
jgi:hypothetical protein